MREGERRETDRQRNEGSGSAARRGQPGAATDTSSEATTSMAAAGGSSWALGQRGESTPPGSVVVSGTGAVSGRRVEEQKRWQVAQ